MPEIETRGARLVYDDVGEGEPALLCLPGWCEPRTAFDGLAPTLAQSHRVIVLDWAGQGESTAPPGDFTAADWLSDAYQGLILPDQVLSDESKRLDQRRRCSRKSA